MSRMNPFTVAFVVLVAVVIAAAQEDGDPILENCKKAGSLGSTSSGFPSNSDYQFLRDFNWCTLASSTVTQFGNGGILTIDNTYNCSLNGATSFPSGQAYGCLPGSCTYPSIDTDPCSYGLGEPYQTFGATFAVGNPGAASVEYIPYGTAPTACAQGTNAVPPYKTITVPPGWSVGWLTTYLNNGGPSQSYPVGFDVWACNTAW